MADLAGVMLGSLLNARTCVARASTRLSCDNDISCDTTTHNSHVHFTNYNDDFYIEYVTRVNGPDGK